METVYFSCPSIIEPCSLEGFNYQIDPYINCEHKCLYCYTQNQSKLDWETQIGIYLDMERRLKTELSLLKPQKIYMGMNTDPYQPMERRYKATRKVLNLLKREGFSVSILTKSDLVTRDMELFKKMPDPSIGTSVAFQEEWIRRLFEENSISNQLRIKALSKLKREGIKTYALICPVMPYITNVELLINNVYSYVEKIWIYPLKINSEKDKNWRKIKPIVKKYFPSIFKKFEEAVFLPKHSYWNELKIRLENLKMKKNFNLEICI